MFSALLQLFACLFAMVSGYCAASAVLFHIEPYQVAPHGLTLEEVLQDRTLSFLLFAGASVVAAYAIWLWLLPLLLAVSYVASRKAGPMLEKRKAEELRVACEEDLDELADIVSMGVGAGLSFDAALELYCSKFEGALSREIKNAQLQWQCGMASREEALEDLAQRIGSAALKRFAETSLQAVRYGSPLSVLMADLAQDLRVKRCARLEREVEKAPVKMLIPTGVCILPAMLILVMGPAILQFVGVDW